MTKASWEDTPPVRRLIARVLKLAGFPGMKTVTVTPYAPDAGPAIVGLVNATDEDKAAVTYTIGENGGLTSEIAVSTKDLYGSYALIRSQAEQEGSTQQVRDAQFDCYVERVGDDVLPDTWVEATVEAQIPYNQLPKATLALYVEDNFARVRATDSAATLELNAADSAIYMKSPNGSRWKLTISNTGTVTVTAA